MPRCTTNSIGSAISSRGKSTNRDAPLPWPSGALSRHKIAAREMAVALHVDEPPLLSHRRPQRCSKANPKHDPSVPRHVDLLCSLFVQLSAHRGANLVATPAGLRFGVDPFTLTSWKPSAN